MKTLIIATTNKGKTEEFIQLLSGLSARVVTPSDLGIHLSVDETGDSYAENAALKARAFCQASGILTLADDSGLEVYSLDGAPGIYSARYSPQPGATDAIRRAFLLQNLKIHPRPWKANFHAVVALAVPAQKTGDEVVVHVFDGVCRGEIIPDERGMNGFGYDPIFLLPEFNRTMAQLTMEEKNRVSHRARAVFAALPTLRSLV